jgi:hypothetical protein
MGDSLKEAHAPLAPDYCNTDFEASTLRIYRPEIEIDSVDPAVDVTMQR